MSQAGRNHVDHPQTATCTEKGRTQVASVWLYILLLHNTEPANKHRGEHGCLTNYSGENSLEKRGKDELDVSE